MRYEDVTRLRTIESVWVRLKLWFQAPTPFRKPVVSNLNHLSEHERRDIGIPEPVRYADWRGLRNNGWDDRF